MQRASVFVFLILALGIGACVSSSDRPLERRVGNLVVSGVPEIPSALVERMQRFRNTRSATLLGWLA